MDEVEKVKLKDESTMATYPSKGYVDISDIQA